MDATCTDCNEFVTYCRCNGGPWSAWSGPHLWTAQQANWFHEQGYAKQEVFRHKKTGGVYGVVCNATRESDGELLVVYRNVATGERWVRPASEFNDGRFERVA